MELRYLIVILLGFVAGLILYKLCNDEVKAWKGRMRIGLILSILLSIFLGFTNYQYKVPLIVTLSAFAVMNLVILFRARKS